MARPVNRTQTVCERCGSVRERRNGKSRCHVCQHAWNRRHRLLASTNPEFRRANLFRCRLRDYGITEAQFEALVAIQSGVCAICQRTPSGGGVNGMLQVDHCHATGKIRGLLCHHCNSGLGKFRDEPTAMENAAAYIRASRATA